MTEHGIFYEHHGLYDQVLRIPLILRLSGKIPEGRRTKQMFHHQDLAQTLIEATGLSSPRTMKGISFWKTATGEDTSLTRNEVFSCESTLQAKWSLRTRDYKFILAREPDFYDTPLRELYDLREDPSETRNIAAERPEIAQQMETRLEAWIAEQLQQTNQTDDPLRVQGISLKAVLQGVY